MTIASTKSARRKGSAAKAAAARRSADRDRPPSDEQPPEPGPASEPPRAEGSRTPVTNWPHIPDRLFLGAGLAILLVALALRILALALNPFHHDEGINGWFLTNLVRNGVWSYDPANYHGPTLFYFALVAEILFGLTTEAMRLVPVVFGLGTVALVLALRPFVGSLPALTGAALLAVSPGATYVSRYFIHEALVVFFTLAIVVALLYFLRDGRQRYLAVAAGSAALLFATKETGIVNVGVLAIAAVLAVAYVRFRDPGGRLAAGASAGRGGRRGNRPGGRPGRPATAVELANWRERFTFDGVAVAMIVFAALYALFFSSFLTNPEGLLDSLATFTIWTQTGTETQVQPFQQYLVWMLRADAPILLLGLAGGLIVAWRAHSLAAVFIGLWALGITLAFSLVTYKTPWIALNMLAPLAILGGLGVAEAARLVRDQGLRAVGTAGLAGVLAFSGYQAIDINFVHYDDETYPYVFVHTTREALGLVEETQRIAAAAGTNEETGIVFMTPEYWPLPWYYRDYPRAGFFGQIVPTEEHMIVGRLDQEQDPAFQEIVEGPYQRRGVYRLRPGVDLVLYVRNDLANL